MTTQERTTPESPAPALMFDRLTVRQLDLVDNTGKVRARLEAYDAEIDGGASIKFFDVHGRRVLDVGVCDGLASINHDGTPVAMHVFIDRIANDASTTIDPDLDFKVCDSLSAKERIAERNRAYRKRQIEANPHWSRDNSRRWRRNKLRKEQLGVD